MRLRISNIRLLKILLRQDPYIFWNSVSKLEDPVSGDLRYSVLPRLAKALLILPHGNADTVCF